MRACVGHERPGSAGVPQEHQEGRRQGCKNRSGPLKSKEPRRLPVMLPDEVAVEMVKTYQANARDGLKGQIAGMQAAYRLFLDRVEL